MTGIPGRSLDTGPGTRVALLMGGGRMPNGDRSNALVFGALDPVVVAASGVVSNLHPTNPNVTAATITTATAVRTAPIH
jgi:hypothetical protein